MRRYFIIGREGWIYVRRVFVLFCAGSARTTREGEQPGNRFEYPALSEGRGWSRSDRVRGHSRAGYPFAVRHSRPASAGGIHLIFMWTRRLNPKSFRPATSVAPLVAFDYHRIDGADRGDSHQGCRGFIRVFPNTQLTNPSCDTSASRRYGKRFPQARLSRIIPGTNMDRVALFLVLREWTGPSMSSAAIRPARW